MPAEVRQLLHQDAESLFNEGLETVETGLDNYWQSFLPRVNNPELTQKIEFVNAKVSEFIFENNLASAVIESPEYKQIYQKEKELRGPCAIGATICIDGRLPIIGMFGRVGNVTETLAGVIEVVEAKIDHRPELASGRLTESIIERARSGEPLLEIMVSHTSFSQPDEHGCGAMKNWQKEHPENKEGDLVLANLERFQPAVEAITDLYNRNVEPDKQLGTVAITAAYDTDTMGFMLGYENDVRLFTTDLTKEFASEHGDFGVRDRQDLNKVDYMVFLESMISDFSEVLLTNQDSFLTKVNSYIDNHLPTLSAEQAQALRFVLARNVAYQYITGCYKPHAHHTFAHHAEKYQAISNDGRTVGQFLPDSQVFGASPAQPQEKIKTIATQCQLMDQNRKVETPYILFLSAVVGVDDKDRSGARDRVRDLWRLVTQDDDLLERIKTDNLIPVPVLIDQRSREILEVVNAAA